MALIQCSECQHEISDKAEKCPHCGAPVERPRAKSGCGGIVLIFFLVLASIFILVAVFGDSGSNKTTAQGNTCASDWMKCSDNAELVNNYSKWFDVRYSCERQATKQAKYGTPKWPSHSFGSFYPGTNYISTGMAVAVEKDAQFQNGFGAMVHSTIICKYNLRSKTVTDVMVLPH